jgi:subtilase family serine protease
MKVIHIPLKLVLPIVMGFVSMQAYALPSSLGIAHTPIHIKPDMPTLVAAGLSPALVRRAYGFNSIPLLGDGQVIAIVDAYDDPNIESDLATFNNNYQLPACTTNNGCFQKVYASGNKPPKNSGWALEISLDVEWAHAMAPNAKIILVEAASDSINDLMTAVHIATSRGANVVSMSWGMSEAASETSLDTYFKVVGVTFVAASGDNGTGTIYPSTSPYVLSTGGTSLSIDSKGNYISESAWSGSGGGISLYEKEPTYQSSFPLPKNPNKKRGVPDVSYNADPNIGYAVYDSVSYEGQKGWFVVGGTSASSPQWAALIADTNATNHRALQDTNAMIYAAASKNYSINFHDITSGSNGSCGYYCNTQTGYDYVTGLGSPQANGFVDNVK